MSADDDKRSEQEMEMIVKAVGNGLLKVASGVTWTATTLYKAYSGRNKVAAQTPEASGMIQRLEAEVAQEVVDGS